MTETLENIANAANLFCADDDNGEMEPAVREALTQSKAVHEQHKKHLNLFLSKARNLSHPSAKEDPRHLSRIQSLSHFVATDLLKTLNEINEGIRRALEETITMRKEQAAVTKQIVSESITHIEEVSMSVRLIAINAGVEAAHAGDAGLGFSVIANEIKRLGESTNDAAQKLKNEITRLA